MKFYPNRLEKIESYNLFVSSILPRPIALVSTVGLDGTSNVAPYSNFMSLCVKPFLVCIGIGYMRDGKKKDTLRNIEATKEFVVNIVDETLSEAMNKCSAEYASDVSEFDEAGLTAVPCDLVKVPKVAESPVSMECKLVQVLEFGERPTGNCAAIGEVVLFHVKDELWTGKDIDGVGLKAVGRLGGNFYCRTTDRFAMRRPLL